MAQIKKLKSGGESPTPASDKPKRIFNGVELTDEYLNALESSLGQWGKKKYTIFGGFT